ncbi:hypothetical protein E6O75_ATG06308 [Venturia nashicola]|uniref:Uncharacterized protein n=1 Tax=Venturia nashicola TaxID=86259 RepID=A0A4Z1NUG5_9PEZI|nr:hypothetical protein E6O75_ATG06308 [Venturia nashicola]
MRLRGPIPMSQGNDSDIGKPSKHHLVRGFEAQAPIAAPALTISDLLHLHSEAHASASRQCWLTISAQWQRRQNNKTIRSGDRPLETVTTPSKPRWWRQVMPDLS